MLAAPLLLAESGNKKQPVPSEAAQAEAMKIVKEVFGSEYAKAESLAAKQALARRFSRRRGTPTMTWPASLFC